MRWKLNFPMAQLSSELRLLLAKSIGIFRPERTHRAVNVGAVPYEEVTVFFLNHPAQIPQPEAG
jgi:hypothetical protein